MYGYEASGGGSKGPSKAPWGMHFEHSLIQPTSLFSVLQSPGHAGRSAKQRSDDHVFQSAARAFRGTT